jgi:hypothetical protein
VHVRVEVDHARLVRAPHSVHGAKQPGKEEVFLGGQSD